jgi:hypothetical protein
MFADMAAGVKPAVALAAASPPRSAGLHKGGELATRVHPDVVDFPGGSGLFDFLSSETASVTHQRGSSVYRK